MYFDSAFDGIRVELDESAFLYNVEKLPGKKIFFLRKLIQCIDLRRGSF
jgi:hypothetical protein